MFGGRSPEPAADHLDELESAVLSEKHTLGLATDGDADRFGVIDSDGTFIEPNKLIALLADYLLETRGLKL
ncbi:phosphoglucomutase/phosphomannomutase family protein, partial [Acinetobacter baumannii]